MNDSLNRIFVIFVQPEGLVCRRGKNHSPASLPSLDQPFRIETRNRLPDYSSADPILRRHEFFCRQASIDRVDSTTNLFLQNRGHLVRQCQSFLPRSEERRVGKEWRAREGE